MRNFIRITIKEIWASTIQFFILLFLGIIIGNTNPISKQNFSLSVRTIYCVGLIIAGIILIYYCIIAIKKFYEMQNIIWSAWTQKLHQNPQTSQLYQRESMERLFEEMVDDLCKGKLKHISRNEIEKFADRLLVGVDKGYSNVII